MRRRGIVFVLLAVVLAGGGWALTHEMRKGDEQWVRVVRKDLAINVPVEGELRATSSASLGPPQVSEVWNFKIAFMAPEGIEAVAGQSLLRFDTSELQRGLERRMAERDAAEKELEKAQTDFAIQRRDKELQRAEASARLRRAELKLTVPDTVASSTELGQARIDQRLAQLDVQRQDRALDNLKRRSEAELGALRQTRDRRALQVQNLERQIGLMTIVAPRAGTVIYLRNRGEKMKVGDTVWRGGKVLEIPDLNAMQADGKVDESDAGRVAVGQPVTLRLDSHPDEIYRGTVASIRRAVQRKSRANPEKVVRLEIALDETDTVRMRPGMRYRGTIEVDRVVDTLVIPEDAVFAEPGGLAVYVKTWNGRRTARPVFGPRNAESFTVREHLEEGDLVLRRSFSVSGGSSS